MKSNKFLPVAMVLTLGLLSACNGNKKATPSEPGKTDSDSVAAPLDTTIYGKMGECGMSTFCLITDKGDTLFLDRDAEDGHYGEIDGDLNEGDRFSLTTYNGKESLGIAINLTQLAYFKLSYKIGNGHLILDKDTVKVLRLDADSLIVKYPNGKRGAFGSKRQH